MRTSVRIRDGVRKRQYLVVVTIVILQHDIDKHFIALPRNHDRLWVQDLFVLAQLLYELFDAVFVEKFLLLHRIAALICDRDIEAEIMKSKFTQARRMS